MRILKADTEVIVRIGPAVDIADGITNLATLDISTANYAYLMEPGSVETDISANTWAAVTNVTGWYDLTLTAAQLNLEGPITVAVYDVDLCLPVYGHFQVVNANVYDSLFAAAATDYLQTDAIQISGSAAAADNLEESTETIISGTAATGTLTTTIFTTDIGGTYTTDDALNGRVIVFKGTPTAALKGQAAVISSYENTNGEITISSPLTVAPANTDQFVIV